MDDEIAKRLLQLNQVFYARFAAPFAGSRSAPQPGFQRLLAYLPGSCDRVLDVGCGNGRFGRFLESKQIPFEYTGVDFTVELLDLAGEQVKGDYYKRDISGPGYLGGLGMFDIIACLATMQHIPGRSNRISMLREMADHLEENGRILLSNWQFLDSIRQQRKIREWSSVDLSDADLESRDFLLSWQREGSGLRYVCAIDASETADLAAAAGLVVIASFRSDGREENLNLYTILAKGNQHKITDEIGGLLFDRPDANATI